MTAFCFPTGGRFYALGLEWVHRYGLNTFEFASPKCSGYLSYNEETGSSCAYDYKCHTVATNLPVISALGNLMSKHNQFLEVNLELVNAVLASVPDTEDIPNTFCKPEPGQVFFFSGMKWVVANEPVKTRDGNEHTLTCENVARFSIVAQEYYASYITKDPLGKTRRYYGLSSAIAEMDYVYSHLQHEANMFIKKYGKEPLSPWLNP